MKETLTGTPQGGIVSPLLANIYLHELDRYMESKYLNLTRSQRETRRKKGIGNVLYVRYADDFVVLCNGTKAEAHATKQEIGELLRTMGLTLSSNSNFGFAGSLRWPIAPDLATVGFPLRPRRQR